MLDLEEFDHSLVPSLSHEEGIRHQTVLLRRRQARPLVSFPIRTHLEETAKQRPEKFLNALSNSGLAVRRYSEGGATGPIETVT